MFSTEHVSCLRWKQPSEFRLKIPKFLQHQKMLIDLILLQLWWNHAPLKGDWNRSGIFENLIHCFFFYFTERSVLFKEYNVLMNIHRMHVSFIPCKTLLKPASPITERLSKRSVLKQRFTKQGVSHWKHRLAKRSVSHFVFYDIQLEP